MTHITFFFLVFCNAFRDIWKGLLWDTEGVICSLVGCFFFFLLHSWLITESCLCPAVHELRQKYVSVMSELSLAPAHLEQPSWKSLNLWFQANWSISPLDSVAMLLVFSRGPIIQNQCSNFARMLKLDEAICLSCQGVEIREEDDFLFMLLTWQDQTDDEDN